MNPSDCVWKIKSIPQEVSDLNFQCPFLSFLPRFALRFIRPDPRSRVTDPVGDIISFIHMFEEKYGRIHPVFYQGTYSQVSVTCWCLDPGEWGFCHMVSGPTWQSYFSSTSPTFIPKLS